MTRVDLSMYGVTIRAAQYCAIFSISARTLRRQLATGTCDVPPRMVQPYRWRKVDIQAHLDQITVAEDRRRKAKLKRGSSRDRRAA